MPLTVTDRRKYLSDRFVVRDHGCHEWLCAKNDNGYGIMRLSVSRERLAHRFSYETEHGAIPRGMEVCHACDNPSCVNPEHLFLATHRANMNDARAKRRLAGQKNTHCKHGHEFTLENTSYNDRGQRQCRECRKRESRERMRRKRSAHRTAAANVSLMDTQEGTNDA